MKDRELINMIFDKSFIQSIMKYHDDFTPLAEKYGLAMNPVARKDYFNWLKDHHHSLNVEETGLFVFKELPFMGPTRDGIVHPTCHGKNLLEIKFPSNHKKSLNFGIRIQFAQSWAETWRPIHCEKNVRIRIFSSSHFPAFGLNNTGKYGPEKLQIRAFSQSDHPYYYQVLQQMLVENLNFWDFYVSSNGKTGNDKFLARIEKDTALCKTMMAKHAEVFDKVILLELITRKSDPKNESRARLCCLCRRYSFPPMIACDNKSVLDLFHYSCVNVKKAHSKNWYCSECKTDSLD